MDGNHADMTMRVNPAQDTRELRGALGTFATGVTVVTTMTAEGPVGITANSFASVSLDPPLVLWSPARSSKRFRHFARAGFYSIHVLAAEQRDLCARFTRFDTGFEGLGWTPNNEGAPMLSGALARFDCALEATYPGGDHDIVLGRVIRVDYKSTGEPLLFHSGQFGRFAHWD